MSKPAWATSVRRKCPCGQVVLCWPRELESICVDEKACVDYVSEKKMCWMQQKYMSACMDKFARGLNKCFTFERSFIWATFTEVFGKFNTNPKIM